MKKFSLLLYVHNVQDFLPQCLNSILKQTEKDFELLIFDNASTDGAFQCLKTYQKKDTRIKIFHCDNEENSATARNTLLKNADGEIVAFLPVAEFKDSFLQYIRRKMYAETPDVLIIRTNKEYLKVPSCADGIYSVQNNKKELFFCNLPIVENVFYSNSFLKKTKIKFCDEELGADFAFYIQTISLAKKIYFAHKNLLKTTPRFCDFSNRELTCYHQFSNVIRHGADILKKYNLWQSTERFYVEAAFYYLQILSFCLPFPIKNFFLKFTSTEILKQINPEKFDRKLYSSLNISDWFYEIKLKSYPSEKFEKCFYTQKNDIIPVVLSAENDENSMLTDVLLQSLISNSDKDKFYDIYILSHKNLSKHIIKTIESEATENISINFVDIKAYTPDNAFIYMYRLSSLYFFIPDILPQYNRAIFLKNNVIALKDISELNSLDMGNMPIAGTKDYRANSEYVEDKLKLITETYIDDSVLLLDIPLCKKLRLGQNFLHKISSDSKTYRAQDILNTFFIDKINVIDNIYNCDADFICGKRIIKGYPYKIDTIRILDYKTAHPYLNFQCIFADIWWKFARQCLLYESLLKLKKRPISDREYLLMKMFIKEAFFMIFTFGTTRKKHSQNISKLLTFIAEERRP